MEVAGSVRQLALYAGESETDEREQFVTVPPSRDGCDGPR